MLHAYLDDSGSHDQSDHFVVAGYIADVRQWDLFNPHWQEVLVNYGLRHMHMKEFESRFRNPNSEYSVISKSRGEILLYQLAAAIRCRVRLAIGGIVPMEGYREHIKDKHEAYTGHAYTIAVNILLKAIERWAKQNHHTEPIAFFFERGTLHSGELIRELNVAATLPEWKDQGWLGTVSCIPKGTLPALDTADVAAYELYREMVGQRSKKPRRPMLDWAVSRVPNCILTTSNEGMAELVKMRVA